LSASFYAAFLSKVCTIAAPVGISEFVDVGGVGFVFGLRADGLVTQSEALAAAAAVLLARTLFSFIAPEILRLSIELPRRVNRRILPLNG
jgi:hypothetical protein